MHGWQHVVIFHFFEENMNFLMQKWFFTEKTFSRKLEKQKTMKISLLPHLVGPKKAPFPQFSLKTKKFTKMTKIDEFLIFHAF